MSKLISANYWFGCDWVFYEVGYLGLRAGQLSLACAVVYLWNTGYLWVTRPRLYPGIQHDRSVQAGKKQRICTIGGYAMSLTCRGGLMYLSILGKPTDKG